LAVGAHPDDLELACGGTLAAHVAAGDDVHMLVVTGGQSGPGAFEDRIQEAEMAAEVLGATLHWGGLVDCAVFADKNTIAVIEKIIRSVRPDVIYVHHPQDTHQDHRAVAAATLSAGRRHPRIVHYQSPSTTGFLPTVFVDVSDHLDTKMAALDCHRSQVEQSAMVEPDVVVASARHYGAMARITFAEAFSATRFVWDLTSSAHTAPQAASAASQLQAPRATVSDDGTTDSLRLDWTAQGATSQA
jgi:LmbE family N-acetylglucosaminyl deacetylase